LFRTSSEEERKWANRLILVGLFEIEWKTPRHNILVEFLNNWKLDSKHNRIKVMMIEEQKIIDRHLLTKVLKIYCTSETKANRAEMSDARVAMVDIADRVLDTYNTNEGWVVKKMKPEYVNRIVTILPIIY
jgi:hypothetical protein